MRLLSIAIVVAALALAIAVFVFVPRLIRSGGPQASQPQVVHMAAQDVLVAVRDLPAGTVVKSDDVRFRQWPEDAIDPTYLLREKGADPQKVAVGFVVLHGIEAGQPITPQRLLKPGAGGFLAAELVPGMHAVSLKIDAVSAAAGFILPDDRVDVALTEHYTVTPSSGTQQASQNLAKFDNKEVSSIILRDVRVLAIDQGVADIDSKPKLGATATLEVDLLQAQKIEVAAQLGSLSLILRSHTVPTAKRPEPSSPIVEDFQVSPFRAALLRQVYSKLAAAQLATQEANDLRGGGMRIYRGAQAAAAQP
jgi:pilus assembly protein CpaB